MLKKLIASAIVIAMFAMMLSMPGVSAAQADYKSQSSSGAGATFSTYEYAYSSGTYARIYVRAYVSKTEWYTVYANATVDCVVRQGGGDIAPIVTELKVHSTASLGGTGAFAAKSVTKYYPIGGNYWVIHTALPVWLGLHYNGWQGYAFAGSGSALVTSSRQAAAEFLITMGWSALKAALGL